MAGKSVPAAHRTFGSLLGAGGLAVLVAASTAACGSASSVGPTNLPAVPVISATGSPASPAGPSSGVPAAAPTTTATPVPTVASSTGGGTVGPINGLVGTPQAQLTAPPAGARLTPFESASRSASGTILYLGLVSQGGACGQYDVVLEQSSSSVEAGLVHLSAGDRICPMFMGRTLIEARLSAPLGDRSVIDLADDQTVPVSLG